MALYFVNFSDFPLLALVVEPVGTISLKDRKNTLFSLLGIRKNSMFFLSGTVTGGMKILVNRSYRTCFCPFRFNLSQPADKFAGELLKYQFYK